MYDPRFIVDETGENEWQIYDAEVQGSPTVYMLYVLPVVRPPFNYQIILTVYDGATAAFTTMPELQAELWSVHFYSRRGIVLMMEDVFDVLLNNVVDINNPLELGFAFGGLVKNNRVVSAKMHDTH
jgi:hypothetical protein